MAVACRRYFTFSLFSLSLLSSLSILFSVRRINIYRGTTLVVLSNTMTEDNPVINNNIRKLEAMGRLADITTHLQSWNAVTTKPAIHSEDGNVATEVKQLMKFNSSISQEQGLTTSQSKRTPNSLLREVLGRGRRDQPPPVWRGRDSAPDAETRKLQQMFPLSTNFSFPNPQV